MKSGNYLSISLATSLMLLYTIHLNANEVEHYFQVGENKYIYTTYDSNGMVIKPGHFTQIKNAKSEGHAHSFSVGIEVTMDHKAVSKYNGAKTESLENHKVSEAPLSHSEHTLARPDGTYKYDSTGKVVSVTVKQAEKIEHSAGSKIAVDGQGHRYLNGILVGGSKAPIHEYATKINAHQHTDGMNMVKASPHIYPDGSKTIHVSNNEHLENVGRSLCKLKNETGFFKVDANLGYTTCFKLIRPQDAKLKESVPDVLATEPQIEEAQLEVKHSQVSY